jgi:hypothetical protein
MQKDKIKNTECNKESNAKEKIHKETDSVKYGNEKV